MANKKILVADDSLTIQKVIRLALSNEPYEIEAVSDGADACQQIALFQPDIVLIDASLPEKSAYVVKEEVNKEQNQDEIKFILMCSAFEQVNEELASKVFFHGKLTKPFDPEKLRAVLLEVCDDESAPNPPPLTNDTEIKQGLEGNMLPQNLDEDIWDSTTSNEGGESDHPDGDIRKLTESTIQMSGLDEESWSINEMSSSSDDLQKTVSIVGDKTLSDIQKSSPSLNPPPFMMSIGREPEKNEEELTEPPISLASALESNTTPAVTTEEKTAPPKNNDHEKNNGSTPPENIEVAPLSQENLEALVGDQLKPILEETAKKLLPEIAEKLLKNEIHKLLSDPPK